MWKISEGILKSSCYELVQPEDIGFGEPKLSKLWKILMQVLFYFLMLGDASRLSGAN